MQNKVPEKCTKQCRNKKKVFKKSEPTLNETDAIELHSRVASSVGLMSPFLTQEAIPKEGGKNFKNILKC